MKMDNYWLQKTNKGFYDYFDYTTARKVAIGLLTIS